MDRYTTVPYDVKEEVRALFSEGNIGKDEVEDIIDTLGEDRLIRVIHETLGYDLPEEGRNLGSCSKATRKRLREEIVSEYFSTPNSLPLKLF